MDPQTLQRAQMLVQQGVISPAMYQMMMQRSGQPQAPQQFQTGVQTPPVAGSQGARLGQGAGQVIGQLGQKIGNAFSQPTGFASGASSLQTGNGGNWVNPDAGASLLAAMPADI